MPYTAVLDGSLLPQQAQIHIEGRCSEEHACQIGELSHIPIGNVYVEGKCFPTFQLETSPLKVAIFHIADILLGNVRVEVGLAGKQLLEAGHCRVETTAFDIAISLLVLLAKVVGDAQRQHIVRFDACRLLLLGDLLHCPNSTSHATTVTISS